jgi:MOSC domain-containing protein YiiM
VSLLNAETVESWRSAGCGGARGLGENITVEGIQVMQRPTARGCIGDAELEITATAAPGNARSAS